MSNFIQLEDTATNEKIWINVSAIVCFYSVHDGTHTKIFLSNNDKYCIVKETTSEVIDIINKYSKANLFSL